MTLNIKAKITFALETRAEMQDTKTIRGIGIRKNLMIPVHVQIWVPKQNF